MQTQQHTDRMLRKQEILFVDDEEGVREGWRRMLSAEDRKVRTAADGDSAIRGLKGHPVDLVISDLRMPGVDGLELLEWIHENKPETRFVLITGFGSPEVEEKARKLGAYGYLEKPVSPDELEQIALAALQGERSSWAHAVVADDPALESELVEFVAPVRTEPEVAEAKAAEVAPGTLSELARLMAAPIVGLVYIIFLPVIGIAAAFYAIGMALAKVLRPAVESGIESCSVVFGEERMEPVVEPTLIEPGSLRDFGRLVAAPFKGLAYIVCLPPVAIAVVAYGVGVRIARIFRPANIR